MSLTRATERAELSNDKYVFDAAFQQIQDVRSSYHGVSDQRLVEFRQKENENVIGHPLYLGIKPL